VGQGIAFYDFDGTIVDGNLVTRFAFLLRQRRPWPRAALALAALAGRIPVYVVANRRSRTRFNEMFFRRYRGIERAWLERVAPRVYEGEVEPRIFSAARRAIEADRAAGYELALVSGELDLTLERVTAELGFDHLVCNKLVFEGSRASGEVVPPLVAEEEKPRAMLRLCQERGAAPERSKAYSDSLSDLPMLEAVRTAIAVNPDPRLRKVARARGWTIESWS
jgi:HAD superfamily hydrolase (TIGR01490 family)